MARRVRSNRCLTRLLAVTDGRTGQQKLKAMLCTYLHRLADTGTGFGVSSEYSTCQCYCIRFLGSVSRDRDAVHVLYLSEVTLLFTLSLSLRLLLSSIPTFSSPSSVSPASSTTVTLPLLSFSIYIARHLPPPPLLPTRPPPLPLRVPPPPLLAAYSPLFSLPSLAVRDPRCPIGCLPRNWPRMQVSRLQ